MSDEKSLTVVEKQVTTRYPTMETWQVIERYAMAVQNSREFNTKAEVAIIKAQFCWDYGLPLSAFSSLYVVNGHIATQSDLIAQKMLGHPDFEYDVDEHTNELCTVTVWRRSKRTGKFAKAGTVSYTWDDAKREGHDTKDTYQKHPKDMLFARAITKAYKWHARNIFDVPVNTIEEFGFNEDTIEAEFKAVEAKTIEPGMPDDTYSVPVNDGTDEVLPTKGHRRWGWHHDIVEEKPILVNDDTGEVLLTTEDVTEVPDIPKYNINTLDELLKTGVKDNEVAKAFEGESSESPFPTTEDEINLVVHRLVEKGVLEWVEEEMYDEITAIPIRRVKVKE